MRKAIIENGIVTNVIVERDDEENPQGIPVDGLSVGVGDIYDGVSFSKPLPPPPTVTEMEDAVQAHLDTVAAKAGYDNIYTACTYAEEGAVPKFQMEGKQLRAWRSLVWAYCHTVLKDVQDKKREVPSISQLITELPSTPVFL